MYKKLLASLAILILIAFAAVGCAGEDDANAATTEESKSDDAKQAKKDGEKGEDEDGEDEGGDGDGEDGEDGEDDKDKKKEEAVPVEVAELNLGEIESILRFSTNLEAEEQVQVFSQAKRLVTERLVEEGDRVRKGQVLVRLQDEEQRSALAKVKSQLAKAEREYKQQERLYKQDLISEQVYNDATYEMDQLKIAIEDAQRELTYTEVTAPISGTVTARMVNLGDQVQIGQHLFDIVDFNSLVARVFVPEKHLGELRRGLGARLSAQSAGGTSYTGRVQRISPIVDPKSGTVKVTVNVGAQQGLRPGMYVDVDLVIATHPEAVLVPKRALVYDNDQIFVYRLGEERRVERIFIEARLTDKYNLEPLEGLDAGDQIVIAGQAGLKDGALVKLPGDETEEDEEAEAADKTETERAAL